MTEEAKSKSPGSNAPDQSSGQPSGQTRAEVSDRLPFEPKSNRKKAEKPGSQVAQSAKAAPSPSGSQSGGSSPSQEVMRIPDQVSKRMIRRIAFFCGVPSFLGLSTFFISYWLIVRDIYAVPNSAVLIVSLGLFGLGALGLSYGLLSASWDPDPGSLLGIREFRLNLGRLLESRRSSRQGSNTPDSE